MSACNPEPSTDDIQLEASVDAAADIARDVLRIDVVEIDDDHDRRNFSVVHKEQLREALQWAFDRGVTFAKGGA